MSFILDALKKSEIERQRQSVPGLMDTPPALRRGPLPAWALFLGALLAVNVVVLTVMLMRNSPLATASAHTKPPVAAQVAAPAAAPAAAVDSNPAPVNSHFSPLDATPVYAPEIPVPPAGQAAPATFAASTSPHPAAQRAVPHATHHADPVLVDEDSKADDELLPTINELNLTGAQALPELHLDVHVYATNPADRFVYINMRKYREGNTLQEGPVLEKIRRDGVVLNYHGLRFLLPRQS